MENVGLIPVVLIGILSIYQMINIYVSLIQKRFFYGLQRIKGEIDFLN